MAQVSFQNVTFRYSPEHPLLLRDIGLGFPAGKVSVILGPNGAGKTTLLKLILGWLRPQAGIVAINDKAVNDYTGRERGRLMSLVPQSEYIPFEYSLLEYVLLGRIPYMKPLELPGKTHLEIAARALERAGLNPNDRRPITILSGGELQLMLLARSLCQEPELLILDEPTSHLDLANKKRLAGILTNLRSEGLTVIMTTHEPDFAAAAGEHLVLMNWNGIVASGTMDTTCTAEMLSRTYDTDVTVKSIEGKKTVFWW
jgi:iron complex transport system ATP-binding protein